MARYTIRVNKGATYRLAVVWRAPLLNPYNGEPAPLRAGKPQPGPPISLAGCTARMQIRRSVSATEAQLTLTSEDGEIALSQPAVSMDGWVRAASTGPLTLSGIKQVIDGVKVVEWDQVLVRAQANPEDNGIYIVRPGAWEQTGSPTYPSAVFVSEGAGFKKTVWRISEAGTWQRLDDVGRIFVQMSPEQTAPLESGVYDLEITSPDGQITRLLEGKVRVSSEVTRDE